MLRAVLTTAALCLALAWFPGTAAARECKGGRLLPTIVSYPPESVQAEQIDVDGEQHWGLTFGTGLGNFGDGPLTMIGHRNTRANPVMRTTQYIRCRQGPAIRRGDTGGMRFAPIRTHFHWHLRDLERYRLLSLDSGRSYNAGKRGFCLGDSYELGEALPRTPKERQFAGDLSTACAKNSPGAGDVRLGLSVGWGDSYPPIIEGQYVDLEGVPAGTYRLLMEVDPFDRILMGSRENVTAGVELGLTYEGDTPKVEYLGDCRTVAECSSPELSGRSEPTGLAALGRAPEGFLALRVRS